MTPGVPAGRFAWTPGRFLRLLLFGTIALTAGCERRDGDVSVASPSTNNQEREPADLLFLNGTVYTMVADAEPVSAVAVRDGLIVAVGSTSEISNRFSGPVEDLAGRMLLPAFHDAHLHLVSGGLQMLGCDLSGILEEAELLAAIQACNEETVDGEWLIGEGWELSVFPDGNPHKRLLDAIAGHRPVLLRGADGHSSWANSAALKRAGLSADTADPPNGRIERDSAGEPTGTLRESAMALLEPVLPPVTHAQRLAAARVALAHAASLGVTSMIDAALGAPDHAVLAELEAAGELTARIVGSVPMGASVIGAGSEALLDPSSRDPRRLLRLDAVKLFLDGVLEGESAALIDPYLNRGGARGKLIHEWDSLVALVTRLDAAGVQIHMHAIGDAAVRQGLDAIEAARETNGAMDNRHHVSHLQLVHEADHARFAALDVRANTQSLWAYPDAYITDVNLPVVGAERVARMYPWASLQKAGAILVGGSDWPVSSLNPLEAIEVAVTRQDPTGAVPGVLNAAEAISLQTALEAYTVRTAELMHQAELTGTVEVGKMADLVVLDDDLFLVEPSAIGSVTVALTLFRGKVIYRRPAARG